MPISYRQTIQDLLRGLPTRKLDALKHLFWSELNYDRADTPLSTRDWSASLRGYLEGPPVLFATAGDDAGFHVIYCRLTADLLLLTHERPVIARLLNEQPYALFVFSDRKNLIQETGEILKGSPLLVLNYKYPFRRAVFL